ncbi:MAG: hypothetical protein TUN42_04350 [Dehalogenimonas sp.]
MDKELVEQAAKQIFESIANEDGADWLTKSYEKLPELCKEFYRMLAKAILTLGRESALKEVRAWIEANGYSIRHLEGMDYLRLFDEDKPSPDDPNRFFPAP